MAEQGSPLGYQVEKESVCQWKQGQRHGNNTEVLLPTVGRKFTWSKLSWSCQNCGGQKNRIFFKYINGKRQCKNIISPFQDGDGHLTNRERDMAEVFSTSFVSVCKTWVTDQEGPSALSWRTMTVTVINPSQPETAGCAAPAESLQIRGP